MIELSNVSKFFGGFPALQSIDLAVRPGEIHGLAGVNGSGKSTLLNIISGQRIIQDTGGFSGLLTVEGRRCRFASPAQAVRAGIGMVHQEFALIPGLSVSENVSLSGERTVAWSRKLFGADLARIDGPANEARTSRVLKRLGVEVDPACTAGALSVSLKQFVEIAREMNRDRLKLLLLDEPTAVLGGEDAARLMSVVRGIAANGTAVLYVSHRLEELVSLCDRITVLRNGKAVGVLEKKHSSIQRLSELMVGQAIIMTSRRAERRDRKPLLQFSAFTVQKPGDCLEGLDLEVFQGEILGITSLSGHGRTALGAGVMGMYPASGTVRLRGTAIAPLAPSRMIRENIWMLPEDRRREGLLLDHSIWENMSFAALQNRREPFVRRIGLPLAAFADGKQCRAFAQSCIDALDIRCRSLFQKVGQLSGGNQQKVCIASALSMGPDLLFVNDPTRGIDIAAKEAILALLVAAHARQSMTLVVSSGELDELKRICDRIAVFYKGRLVDVLAPEESDRAYLLALSGTRPEGS